MSGGRGPVVPSLLRNKEAGRVKVITGLIQVRKKIKAFREAVSGFTQIF